MGLCPSLCHDSASGHCYLLVANGELALEYVSVYMACTLWVVFLQGPLPNTCGHFWEMVWEQKSRGVVMLNRVMEKGSVSVHLPIISLSACVSPQC